MNTLTLNDIARMRAFCSKDKYRKNLHEIYCDGGYLVATDGHALAYTTKPVAELVGQTGRLVGGPTRPSKGGARQAIVGSVSVVDMPGGMQFPHWRQVVPEAPTQLQGHIDDIGQLLDAAPKWSTRSPIRWVCVLSSNGIDQPITPIFAQAAFMPVPFNAQTMVATDPRLLFRALELVDRGVGGINVRIRWEDSLSPIEITNADPEQDVLRAVVMPTRFGGEK